MYRSERPAPPNATLDTCGAGTVISAVIDPSRESRTTRPPPQRATQMPPSGIHGEPVRTRARRERRQRTSCDHPPAARSLGRSGVQDVDGAGATVHVVVVTTVERPVHAVGDRDALDHRRQHDDIGASAQVGCFGTCRRQPVQRSRPVPVVAQAPDPQAPVRRRGSVVEPHVSSHVVGNGELSREVELLVAGDQRPFEGQDVASGPAEGDRGHRTAEVVLRHLTAGRVQGVDLAGIDVDPHQAVTTVVPHRGLVQPARAGHLIVGGERLRPHGHITAVCPPSTTSAEPVMNAESDEARNAYAAATSSSVPARPSGIELSM